MEAVHIIVTAELWISRHNVVNRIRGHDVRKSALKRFGNLHVELLGCIRLFLAEGTQFLCRKVYFQVISGSVHSFAQSEPDTLSVGIIAQRRLHGSRR